MPENPAARLATSRKCAQTVLFLAGPESDFFYGQIIPFAGGWTVSASGAVARRARVLGTMAVGSNSPVAQRRTEWPDSALSCRCSRRREAASVAP